MKHDPLLLVLMIAVGAYVMHLWRQDYRAAAAGRPNPGALPGAAPATVPACVIAALGGFLLVTGETWGELHLGISEEQSEMTVLFGINTLVAAFVEELIFRGFIVINNRGRLARWAGVFAASILFTALHPFLWKWDMGETATWQAIQIWRWDEWFTWQFTLKGWFSAGVVFVSSLWFYFVRFAAFNPTHSLLPCIAAHASKNIGVFVIKAAQGFITGIW